MELKRLICSCCGGELTVKDEKTYLCRYCGAHYEKESAEEMQDILSSYLEKDKLERLVNARRVLYDAAIKAEYPSEKKVVAAATNVLSINPDDPFASAVSYSYEEDGYNLANLLPNLNLDQSTADQIYRWLMRDVSARLIGPLSDFVQRHFDGKDLVERLSALEDEAEKEQEGYYLSTAPRDVFICYSSKDMPEVIHLIDILEENGYTCFAAFRNLRHGRGAKENYLNEIYQAMEACKTLIFVSSKNSRTPMCDAIKVELPYLTTKLANKPRFEYMIDKDDGHTAIVAKKIIKEAFPTQERVHDEETLVSRIEELEKSTKAPLPIPPQYYPNGAYPYPPVNKPKLSPHAILLMIASSMVFIGLFVDFIIAVDKYYYWKTLKVVFTEPSYGYIAGVLVMIISGVFTAFELFMVIRKIVSGKKTKLDSISIIVCVISLLLTLILAIVCLTN